MPSTEKNFKSELTGTIDSFLSSKRAQKGEDVDNISFLNIIEFIERFKLLPNGLYPVQKFILKLYYNIPLDDILPEDENDRIKITDRFGKKILQELTEVQYLKFLYGQGRCNIEVQDSRERRELILCIGRRGSKSTICSLVSAYELYKLLRRGHPQKYYGIPDGNEIRILCLANDKEQASIVFGEMENYIEPVDYFKNSKIHHTQSYLKFQTDNDKKKFGDGSKVNTDVFSKTKTKAKGTITATFKSSVAKGLRGRGIICAILDEIAFFIDNGMSSAERVYNAINPSIAQFSPKDPKNRRKAMGPSEGRIISISSPDAKEGFFYRLYQQAMSNGPASQNMLMIQAPTWEINPSLDVSYYETEYYKNPKNFATEHGAEFSDRVRGWIEDKSDLTDCINPELRPIRAGIPREPYFAGVDFAIAHDGTAIALTHLKNGKIELGYHEVWYPRKRWKESNPHLEVPMIDYAMKLQDVTRLDLDEIAEWFRVLATRFFITKGILDQHTGHVVEQALHKKGLLQFEMRNFTTSDSSQIYMNAKMLLLSKQLSIYDFPLPESVVTDMESKLHSPFIQELLELQSTSGGKNMVIVEAPNISGKHDDQSDAFVRSVWLASEYIKEHPGILESTKGTAQVQPRTNPRFGYKEFHRARRRMHGGTPRERIIPSAMKRR